MMQTDRMLKAMQSVNTDPDGMTQAGGVRRSRMGTFGPLGKQASAAREANTNKQQSNGLATQGSFETLQPLVMRLNGSALMHLAEIISIEPASMYHSLNDELLQRTGTSVPLTEYVSLQSELQHLLVQQQNTCSITSSATTCNDINKSNTRRKRKKKSRLCTIL